MIVALDFTKAIDSMHWDFIRFTLEWFGFDRIFLEMVYLIFNQTEGTLQATSSRRETYDRGLPIPFHSCCRSDGHPHSPKSSYPGTGIGR